MNRRRLGLVLLVLSLLVVSLTGPACANRSETSPYEFTGFTRLDIQNAFDIEVIQSGTFSVSVTSSEALIDYLSVIQTGDTLVIKLQPNHPFTDFVTMRKVLKAKIAMPSLSSVKLSGACDCILKGFETTGNLELDVSGASHLNLNRIETGDMAMLVSGDSKVFGKLAAADVEMDVSGASEVDITGTAEDCRLNASGASKLNLEFFVNQSSMVTLSGSSQATVDTRKDLGFNLSGASRLFFLSNPNITRMEVLGASTVKHK